MLRKGFTSTKIKYQKKGRVVGFVKFRVTPKGDVKMPINYKKYQDRLLCRAFHSLKAYMQSPGGNP